MNPLEEQKGLVEFLEAALDEARGQSPLDQQQIQRLEAELAQARSDLSRLSSASAGSERPAPVAAAASLPAPCFVAKLCVVWEALRRTSPVRGGRARRGVVRPPRR